MCEFERRIGDYYYNYNNYKCYYYKCPIKVEGYCFWHEERGGKRIDRNKSSIIGATGLKKNDRW